ncbi:hypothetical protein [Streptomyces sp. NPDC101145]|uniref:hypothetical protein n=1 Tax=Streptomyces sp. NPDC101145 TaxID=3366112 RepID=UPI00382FC57A
MTVIPHPVSSLPRTAPVLRPGILRSAKREPEVLPVWLVTMPTVAADGTGGTQWFAVRTHTAAQAMAEAAVQARSAAAVAHRRGARVRVEQAEVALWKADSPAYG